MTAATIPVTAAHLAAGVKNRCDCCPVALAFLAAFPAAETCSVNYYLIVAWFSGTRMEIRLPAGARERIHAIDGGQQVEPFEFGIEMPEGVAV